MRAAHLASGVAIVGVAIAAAILVVAVPNSDAPGAGALPVTRDALEAHVERAPRDGRAWLLLARAELGADRFQEAADAYERGLATSRKAALDPGVWCEYADALGMAQGGRLAGRPRELIERALALNAAHPKALEMAGSAAYERGDFDAAARYWKQLLPQLAEGTLAHGELAAAVARAERRAGGRAPLTDRAG
jgi:cytochrome c-type biogenesis protein CcmH